MFVVFIFVLVLYLFYVVICAPVIFIVIVPFIFQNGSLTAELLFNIIGLR